jgi:hypothetical protein
MFHRRHMPTYLVVGWLLLDVVLFAGVLIYYGRIHPPVPVLLLLLGQFMAITGWIALGEEGIGSSAKGLGIGGIVWALLVSLDDLRLLALMDIPLVIGATFASELLYAGALNFLPFIARGAHWSFRFEPESSSHVTQHLQFSIRGMMFYTVLVALIAGLWSASRPSGPIDIFARPGYSAGEIGCGVVGFVIPWCIWASFAVSRPFHGAIVAFLVTSFWGVVLHRWMLPGGGLYLFIPATTMILHILALQIAGFRLRRYPPEFPKLVGNSPDQVFVDCWKRLGE